MADKVHNHRRKFLKNTLLQSIALAIGAPVVYGKNLTKDILPIALFEEGILSKIPGKSDLLTLLNDRPVNAETPAHLLDNDLTPNDLFFVRNNGIPPSNPDKNQWTLSFDGESVKSKKTYSLEELKNKFEPVKLIITLECGGNGRKEFNPPAKGNQWSTGAVGCAEWTGVKLKDVLKDVGLKSDATYLAYYGKDSHLSGDPKKDSISRGVPIQKAMEDESIIAWEMNGKDIPLMNGYPLRLVFGGYPASCSGKWLSKIAIRNKVHDGAKMGGQSYRIPCDPVAPGAKVEDSEMCIIENMPVKSLITYPQTGATIKKNQSLPIRGHAWTHELSIKLVEYSIDFGINWKPCNLLPATNRYAWQNFSAEIQFPKTGYYEVWARATDSSGDSQPIILPGWNPKGYLNNACHRIAIKVES